MGRQGRNGMKDLRFIQLTIHDQEGTVKIAINCSKIIAYSWSQNQDYTLVHTHGANFRVRETVQELQEKLRKVFKNE